MTPDDRSGAPVTGHLGGAQIRWFGAANNTASLPLDAA